MTFFGKLKLDDKLAPLADAQGFASWLAPLYLKDWVVYVQPPIDPPSGPDAVLKYLARYVAGAAISDRRLLSHEAGQVTFRVKDYRQDRKRKTLTLAGVEFTRRFLLHVLPRGLVRVRYYGLLANTQRGTLLPRCRELLGASPDAASRPADPAATPSPSDAPAAETAATCEAPRCPACKLGRLVLIETYPRRSWRAALAPPPSSLPLLGGGGPCPTQNVLLSAPAQVDSS